MSNRIVQATAIHKSYGNLHVLKGIDIEIFTGEVIAIVGASGSGKSTLLHILGTLDRADSGNVFINNTDVFALSDNKLSQFRNQNIGFVFQFHHLLPEFTALENVCIPAFLANKNKKESENRAMELLKMLNLEQRHHHKPAELSGGEQQRVAVARALMNDPDIVFADEPSGNLDSKNAKELHELFFELRQRLNKTFVIVTHNPMLAEMSDRTLEIKDGVIV
ncbi:MAG: ABC transporter ATP-binding protein [Bacteroidales bacterium]|nr:ABC transporter ATP-binding protein [Bacteroidales bacterium]